MRRVEILINNYTTQATPGGNIAPIYVGIKSNTAQTTNDAIENYLDISNNFKVSLNYSLAEIQDISKRNGAYSLPITLPGTKNNHFWFGHLYDVKSDFTFFNPNFKLEVKLLVDSDVIIEGYLELISVERVTDPDTEGDDIYYRAVIYSESLNLYSDVGELTLQDLDMAEFGHTFSIDSVSASWAHTWEDGYVYPMYYNSDAFYELQDFYPAFFLRKITEKIFESHNYGMTGSLLENDEFNKEIIPYTGEQTRKISPEEQEKRQFKASVTGPSQSFNVGTWSQGGDFIVNGPGSKIIWNNDAGIDGNFDNDNNYDTSTGVWTIKNTGNYDILWYTKGRVRIKNNTGATVSVNSSNKTGIVRSVVARTRDGVETIATSNANSGGGAIFSGSLPGLPEYPNQLSPNEAWESNIAYPLLQSSSFVRLLENDEVTISINVKFGTYYTDSNGDPADIDVDYVIINDSTIYGTSIPYLNYFRVISQPLNLVGGDYLDPSNYLSDKIKQKDILDYIIKKYNCFIQIDPDNNRKLILSPRPDFYDETYLPQNTLDWTDKIDRGSQTIQFLTQLQNREYVFKFKEGKDIWNENYQKETGEVYGQYKFKFANEFVQGSKEIEIPFSPTPLVKTTFNAIVPSISAADPKSDPRILYWGGLKDSVNDGQAVWALEGYDKPNLQLTTETFTQYPYAGHYNDPYNPTVNINFYDPAYVYYPDIQSATDNNAYFQYWSDYLRQIETGKLLTAKFDLSPKDINYIRKNFNTRIFIKDSYYFVNKIVNFNATQEELTTVELIKIDEGIRFKKSIFTGPLDPVSNDPVAVTSVTPPYGTFTELSFVKGGFNSVSSDDNVIIGKNNRLEATNRSIVSGKNNILLGAESAVIGSNNNIIGGSNNLILSGGSNDISPTGSIFLNVRGMTQGDALNNTVYITDGSYWDESGNYNMVGTIIKAGQYYLDIDSFELKNATELKALGSIQNPIRVDSNFTTGALDTDPTAISSGFSTANSAKNGAIIGGYSHQLTSTYSVLIGGYNNEIPNTVTASVIASDYNITASYSNTFFTKNIWQSGSLRLSTQVINGISGGLTYSPIYAFPGQETTVLVCDTSAGPITINPNKKFEQSGFTIMVNAGGSASVNNVTIDPGGSDQIDGSTTRTLSTNYESLIMVYDGNDWYTFS